MSRSSFLFLAALLPATLSQLAGTNTAENHPALTWQKCTGTGGTSCTTQSASIVIDANWRWLHQGTNGFHELLHRFGNTWNTTACPDGKTCADYSGTYGISTSGNALTLKFVTVGQQPNIGSRVYLMAPGGTAQFDVDVSQLPCGLNGALYFSQMDSDGGVAKSNGNNKAGPKYGNRFINGVANSAGWAASPNDTNAGTVRSCCPEMDVWVTACSAANSYGTLPCLRSQANTGSALKAPCDQAGCDFNSYRMGDTTFYGPGLTVDTSKKITVVTQFTHTTRWISRFSITEIKRFYVQNGIQISGATGNSITDSFCAAQKTAFGDTNTFASKGGLAGMSKAASAGMVLVMSIWDDHTANMLWLDAPYPPNKSPSSPGVTRGTCSASSGAPTDVESASANAQVIYSNIKFGSINSTFSATGGSTGGGGGSTTTSSTPPTNTGSCAAQFAQCGGSPWSGPTCCVSPFTCKAISPPFYSQNINGRGNFAPVKTYWKYWNT
ncbi:glycosyl hydrolase family 7-domain-containing protein [Mycena olivaceomarginata]|nr:glycosyl hydrolase family 7-domain-containing protein [Mycena olivaceomarginata]